MSVKKFSDIARSAVSFGFKFLDLTCLTGELFLHKDALTIIETAKAAGFAHIGAYTNGIVLHRFDMERLLTSGLDALLVSFPGFDELAYQKIYQIDGFKEFRTSVEKLLTIHQQMGSKVHVIFEPRTNLTAKQIVRSDFYNQVVKKFVSDQIVLREPLQVFDTWGGDIKKDDLLAGMRLDINPLKSIAPLKRTYLCNRILEIGVLANGDVRLCDCRCDSDVETNCDSLLVDNLAAYDSLEDLLQKNTEKIDVIRRDFERGKLPALCRKCPFYLPVR